MDWRSILAGVAPVLASAVAGPAGPVAVAAVKAIAEHFGVEANEQAVAEAVQAASPADLLALKQLDLEFARVNADLDKSYLSDTQSARARDVSLIEHGYRNSRANTMLAGAGVIVIGILVLIVLKSPLDDYVKTTITLILGRALGYVDAGFNFEFGTTRSSGKKDETISALSK